MKKLTILLSVIMSAFSAWAADVVPVRAVVVDDPHLSATAVKSLGNKVTTMAVESGFGALSSPVVLTATANVIGKSITGTSPAMIATEVEVFFYVADVEEQVILAEKTVVVKGLDKTEEKSVASAINRINPRTPEMRKFTMWAREKVLEYYSSRVPVILKKAQLYADRKEYADALLILSDVPEGIDQWSEAAQMASEIYFKMINDEADQLLYKAEIALSRNDYDTALAHISKISPQSDRIDRAKKMVADIKAENDEIASLREQVAKLTEEKLALENDSQKIQQEIRDYAGQQQELIERNNVSVEKKLTGWLVGKLDGAPEITKI